MKLGFSTLGCPDWKWSEVLNTAKDMRIDGIELRGLEEEIDPLKIEVLDEEHLADTLAQLQGAGIEIPMLGSSVALGGEDAQAQAEEAKKHIDFASRAGIPFVRVLISLQPEPDPASNFDQAKQLYQELCLYARGKKVRVLVETCGILGDSARMKAFMEGADPETSGVLWDIHHPYRYFGETPAQTYENLRGLVQYVHVKDSAMENGRLEYRMMGLGDVPVYDAVKVLHQAGYTGYLMLEWVKRWRPDLRDPDVIFYQFQSYMETLLEEVENG